MVLQLRSSVYSHQHIKIQSRHFLDINGGVKYSKSPLADGYQRPLCPVAKNGGHAAGDYPPQVDGDESSRDCPLREGNPTHHHSYLQKDTEDETNTGTSQGPLLPYCRGSSVD